jgi:hypothetical protein
MGKEFNFRKLSILLIYLRDLTPSPLSKGEGWLAPDVEYLHPSPLERGLGVRSNRVT